MNVKHIFVLLFLSGLTTQALHKVQSKYGTLPYITTGHKMHRSLEDNEGEGGDGLDLPDENAEVAKDEEAADEEGEVEESPEDDEEVVEDEEEAGGEEDDEENPEDEVEEGEEEEDPVSNSLLEHEEIQAALDLIDFKMTEINQLVKECIYKTIAEEQLATAEFILAECVGLEYQILFRNYQEAIARVKEIFLEIIRLKLVDLDQEYDDEINFFLDLLVTFIDKDYILVESLEHAKASAKYYVSPHFFESLMEITKPEIDGFTELHAKLKEQKLTLHESIKEQVAKRQEALEQEQAQIQQAIEAEEAEEGAEEGEYDEEEGREGDEDFVDEDEDLETKDVVGDENVDGEEGAEEEGNPDEEEAPEDDVDEEVPEDEEEAPEDEEEGDDGAADDEGGEDQRKKKAMK